jgi:hypothetical protein
MTVKLEVYSNEVWTTVNQWVFPKRSDNQYFRLTAVFPKQAVGTQRTFLDPQTLFFSSTASEQKKVRWTVSGVANDTSINITGRLLSYRFEGTTNLFNYWGIA